ncbi:hypothetical protein K439DRAFT_1137599 [Ramaria rubella]|nr:hypothetical protein K439DRAFT_1137599 [Ramaria rubella]
MQYLTFALVISSVAALSVRSPFPRARSHIRVRQTGGLDPSDIPTQSDCAPVVSDLSTCSDDSCLCTTQVASDYQACINCFDTNFGNDPNTVSSIQSAVNAFNSECAEDSNGSFSITLGSGSANPTAAPSGTDTNFPTAAPSGTDTDFPTAVPTDTDSDLPTPAPTGSDSDFPSPTDTDSDSDFPSPTDTDSDSGSGSDPTESDSDSSLPTPTSLPSGLPSNGASAGLSSQTPPAGAGPSAGAGTPGGNVTTTPNASQKVSVGKWMTMLISIMVGATTCL